MNGYISLAFAIMAEVIATTALKEAKSFTVLAPSIIVVVAYGISFFFMSQSMKTLPVGIVYALWSGVGIVLVFTIAMARYGQWPDLGALAGAALIIAGVGVLTFGSKMQIQ